MLWGGHGNVDSRFGYSHADTWPCNPSGRREHRGSNKVGIGSPRSVCDAGRNTDPNPICTCDGRRCDTRLDTGVVTHSAYVQHERVVVNVASFIDDLKPADGFNNVLTDTHDLGRDDCDPVWQLDGNVGRSLPAGNVHLDIEHHGLVAGDNNPVAAVASSNTGGQRQRWFHQALLLSTIVLSRHSRVVGERKRDCISRVEPHAHPGRIAACRELEAKVTFFIDAGIGELTVAAPRDRAMQQV